MNLGTSIVSAVLRTTVQALMPTLIVLAAKYNVHFGPEVQEWFSDGLVIPAGVALYTGLVRWLETRDNGFAHWLAGVLMLGLTQQPVYARRPDVPAVAAAVQDAEAQRE